MVEGIDFEPKAVSAILGRRSDRIARWLRWAVASFTAWVILVLMTVSL